MRLRDRSTRAIRLGLALVACLLAFACSSRSVEDADREFGEASTQLRKDIEQLKKSLEGLKANWDVEEHATQAQVHWDRLIASVKAESVADAAYRSGQLIEAKAIAAIRDETAKLRESDATVRSILLHVERLRSLTMRSAPRLQSTGELLGRCRASFAIATWLSEDDRQLIQAKLDVCARRLSELQNLIGTGLKWTLSPIDGDKGIATVETALRELAELDATLREVLHDLESKRPEAAPSGETESPK